jgi:parallel beta-helix repeat protein
MSGIYLSSSSNNEVHYCNIYKNTNYGVYSVGETVNATYNWWGDVSGPGRLGRGIGVGFGTGDAVSANVDYDPWLDAPYLGGQPINFTDATTKTAPAGTTEIDAKTEADTNVSINTTAPVNVTIAEYSRNPGTGFGGDIGKYIDVHVNDTANVTTMTIRLFYTDADIGDLNENENTLRMRWWNATIGEWIACSNTGVNTTDQNGYSGYIWAYIDKTTTPNLSDLEGAPFGGQWSPAPAPVPAFNAIGLLALIGILSAVLAVETSKKKKSK